MEEAGKVTVYSVLWWISGSLRICVYNVSLSCPLNLKALDLRWFVLSKGCLHVSCFFLFCVLLHLLLHLFLITSLFCLTCESARAYYNRPDGHVLVISFFSSLWSCFSLLLTIQPLLVMCSSLFYFIVNPASLWYPHYQTLHGSYFTSFLSVLFPKVVAGHTHMLSLSDVQKINALYPSVPWWKT